MDYDKTELPTGYDAARDHGPEFSTLWMNEITRHVADRPIRTILDVGCGTGRFSGALADAFNARLIGLDPSRKMLARALSKANDSRVIYVCASGESLPIGDGRLDLVFMSMVFHHFGDHGQVAAECRRTLRSHGLVIVRTGTLERIPQYPYVEFIPETIPLLHERMPSISFVESTFRKADFALLAATIVVQQIAPTFERYVEKLAAGGDSVLASLDDRTRNNGFENLRKHARRVDPQPVTEPIDFLLFTRT
jgi:ubiquinone/menaquinone biosynthesis C-methylase UbiE